MGLSRKDREVSHYEFSFLFGVNDSQRSPNFCEAQSANQPPSVRGPLYWKRPSSDNDRFPSIWTLNNGPNVTISYLFDWHFVTMALNFVLLALLSSGLWL